VTPPNLAAPIIGLPASGRRLRVRFTVQCDSSCIGSARITVSRRVAARLGLGRTRTVGKAGLRVSGAGKATFVVTLSRQARRAMTRQGVRRIAVTLRAEATDAESQRTVRRRSARISRP